MFNPLSDDDEGIPCTPCGLKITRSVNDYGWNVITVDYGDGFCAVIHGENDLDDAFVIQAADQQKEIKQKSYTKEEQLKRGYQK